MTSSSDEEVWRVANTAKGRDVKLGRGNNTKRSSFLSPSARSRLSRIISKRPEVVVKITGRTRGAQHFKAHLDYITRNGKIAAETRDGQALTGRSGVRILHDDWLQENAVLARGRNSLQAVQSVSIILSMPAGSPPDRLKEAARTWARETFADRHDWLMAQHEDKDHPHVHVTVRSVGADGKRLTAGPKELQVWRERFARELRRHGVEAEATPRQARGQVRKSDRMPVHKIEKRGRVADATVRTVRLAAKDAALPQPRPAYGWETEIQRRQDRIQEAYLDHAAVLGLSDDPTDKQLARDIKRFVAELPVASTRRQALATELRVVTEDRHKEELAPKIAPSAPVVGPIQQGPTRRR